jgi:hypothetical protein
MKRFAFIAAALLLAAPGAQATPEPYDTARNELLGSLCEEGLSTACRELVRETNGECAGPAGSGCLYDSRALAPVAPVTLAVDNGLMTEVPGFGFSRVETVAFCLEETGAARYQDLITDSQFETFGACLTEQT